MIRSPLAVIKRTISGNNWISTPIFYVNSSPHIGHLYSTVLADVFNRYAKLQGKESSLSTGTDEHGLKVYNAD
jgi:methionyl-tRNA synthetase